MEGFAGPGSAGPAGLSLSEILQQSRKLTNQLGRDSDLPSIQLGIDQIESQSRKLASKSVRNGTPAADARAHYLLASGGIDAVQLTNAIEHTNIANTFEPLQPVYDTDLDGFNRHEHEQVILSMIEESRRETLDDFQRRLGDALHHDWQRQKRRLVEELGEHQPDTHEASALLRRSAGASAAPSSITDDTPNAALLHGRMVRYDTVIARMNRARAEHEPAPVVHAFMETVESMVQDASRKRALLEAWTVLKYMVRGASGERSCAAAYLDLDAFRGAPGAALREAWVAGARAYLEAQFSAYMEQVIAAAPLQAQRGGVPTVRATVAAFLRAQLRTPQGAWPAGVAREMDSETDTPLWAHLFYLVRTGHGAEALQCAHANEAVLQRADGAFLAYFKAWLDAPARQLPRAMREHLMAEYVTRFRATSLDAQDPYHYALYRLMGRFDVAKKFPAALVGSTENWLWLQLCLTCEAPGDGDAQDPTLRALTLRDLAGKLEKYGAAHFDPKGTRPLHYFQLLLLVGEFERAVAFLYAQPAYQVDAVHLAIALSYYGLLRVPAAADASQFELLSVVRGVAYVDLAKMVQRYTRAFASSAPREALAYISVLSLNADAPAPIGAEQVQRCHELVRGLILDAPSSSFVELLGTTRADGTPVPGLVEQHLDLLHLDDQRAFVRRIVLSAAEQCEREQRTTDAILLYNHIGERDTVIRVLNAELGATLMDPVPLAEFQAPGDGAAPASLGAAPRLVPLARSILASYEGQFGYQGAAGAVCHTLLGVKHAVSLYNDAQLLPALQTLEALHVLPLDAEARKDVVSITRKADEFKTLDENLTKNFSDVVLMAMTLLYKLHQELKASVTRTNSGALYEYRAQARALMMWAGMLRFRMSNETYSQLTRLDVYLH
ncbi:nuclear pore complex subunit [Malassezia brasiliensis]|uniref:Nuclear pore protein n=1 Tax=Malassezia brasiliensis TaxID=1821822 RepID=A0AAF0DPX9_9BASI|nr:nuclear pore complex subunit [Malassezia brasiliensis]